MIAWEGFFTDYNEEGLQFAKLYLRQFGLLSPNTNFLDNLLFVGKNIGYPEMVAASISE